MGWLRDFWDEWTAPGYAEDQMARMCLAGCVLVGLVGLVATVGLIFGDVPVHNVVTLWVAAAVCGIAAIVYAALSRHKRGR